MFLLFQKKAHKVLKVLHSMDVIYNKIPKYKFTSHQYNKILIAPPKKKLYLQYTAEFEPIKKQAGITHFKNTLGKR